jgi:VanZ family protein
MARILHYWLPVVAWAALIILFSTDAFHGGATEGILRSVLLFLFPTINQETIELLDTCVRKTAHIAEYCVFTLLLYRAFRQDTLTGYRWQWALLSFLLAVGFAGLDEFHQAFEPRRTGSVIDVGVDAVGALIALAMVWWHYRGGRAPLRT